MNWLVQRESMIEGDMVQVTMMMMMMVTMMMMVQVTMMTMMIDDGAGDVTDVTPGHNVFSYSTLHQTITLLTLRNQIPALAQCSR